MILLGDVRHGEMIARAAHTSFDMEVDGVVSRIDAAGDLCGGFILTNYNGAIVMIHMAGSVAYWATPELVWLMFDYAFVHLGCRKVLCTACSTNENALDQIRRSGFKDEHRIEGGTVKGDLLMLSMSREDCKWLKLRKRYVRQISHGELANVH